MLARRSAATLRPGPWPYHRQAPRGSVRQSPQNTPPRIQPRMAWKFRLAAKTLLARPHTIAPQKPARTTSSHRPHRRSVHPQPQAQCCNFQTTEGLDLTLRRPLRRLRSAPVPACAVLASCIRSASSQILSTSRKTVMARASRKRSNPTNRTNRVGQIYDSGLSAGRQRQGERHQEEYNTFHLLNVRQDRTRCTARSYQYVLMDECQTRVPARVPSSGPRHFTSLRACPTLGGL